MKVPFLDITRRIKEHEKEYKKAVEDVLMSGKYILSDNVESLEDELAEYVGVKYAIGVANGTDALQIALDVLDINENNEVITTPFTFAATADTIMHTGAKVVFADIEEDTMNISPKEIEKKITSKTKAIIVVNLFGHSADWDNIKKVLSKDIFIIEDNAQSLGAFYKNKKTGIFGNISTTSFFPTKNLGGFGDGGMIFTDNEEFYKKAQYLRVHGATRKYHYEYLGYNSRLDELQAALLLLNLKYLDNWNKERRTIASFYNENMKEKFIVPFEKEYAYHIYHQYTIRTDKRDKLKEYLNSKGIPTAIHYPKPLHLHPLFEKYGYERGSLPVSERVADRVLSLPIFPELTEEEREYIVKIIKEW